MPLFELKGVEKRYGELRALKNVNLSVEPGRIGLLGPNGAGKSTLLKTLLGLVAPEHGTVRVLDRDVSREAFEIRARVGYMPEGDTVLPELSALQYTTLAAELCGLPRAEAMDRAHQVLQYVGLGEARYRRLGTFSTGMRQRARLAQALVGAPKLLLLDEPTSGLDPRGREEMLALILDIPKRTGASVLLSTHILPDVEKTCDQVLVLAAGEVLYAGELAPLVRSDGRILRGACERCSRSGGGDVRARGLHRHTERFHARSACSGGQGRDVHPRAGPSGQASAPTSRAARADLGARFSEDAGRSRARPMTLVPAEAECEL